MTDKQPDYTPQIRYAKNAIKRIRVDLNRNTDQDILEHLEQISNMTGYIKALIRADMAKQKKQ